MSICFHPLIYSLLFAILLHISSPQAAYANVLIFVPAYIMNKRGVITLDLTGVAVMFGCAIAADFVATMAMFVYHMQCRMKPHAESDPNPIIGFLEPAGQNARDIPKPGAEGSGAQKSMTYVELYRWFSSRMSSESAKQGGDKI